MNEDWYSETTYGYQKVTICVGKSWILKQTGAEFTSHTASDADCNALYMGMVKIFKRRDVGLL